MDQVFVKIILIAALLIVAARVIIPSRGSRSTAMRRLALIGFFAAAIFAVMFPMLLSDVASLLGIGRGTDLLLYAFIVVFIGSLLSNARKQRQIENHLTDLARLEALRSARAPLLLGEANK